MSDSPQGRPDRLPVKAASFERNDALPETLPIGVLVFPGNASQDNLADKGRKLGIPAWKIARPT